MFGKHASPISKYIEEAIEKGTINLNSEEDLDQFIKGLQELQKEKTGRAAAINLLNINNGKNTIEFRLPNGSINPDTWVENTRLFARIVEMSEKLAQIEKKDKLELTDEEKKLLDLKKQLKQEKPECEKIEDLLELLFTEEEKTIYRERYNENSKSLKEIAEENNSLKNLEFAETVDFKPHKKDEFSDISRQNYGGYIDVTRETREAVVNEQERNDFETIEK